MNNLQQEAADHFKEVSYSDIAFNDRTIRGSERLLRQLVREDPQDEDMIFHVLVRRARLYSQYYSYLTADEQFRILISLSEARYGYFHEETASLRKNFAFHLVHHDHPSPTRWDEANELVRSYLSKISSHSEEVAEDVLDLATMSLCRVLVYRVMWDTALSESMTKEMIREARSKLEVLLPRLTAKRWYLDTAIILVMQDLRICLSREGDIKQALELEKDILRRWREKQFDRNTTSLEMSLRNCAGMYAKNGEFDAAEKLMREGIGRYEMDVQSDPMARATLVFAIAELGQLLEYCNRRPEAELLARPYYDELREYDLITIEPVLSFRPGRARWLPK